MTALKPQPGILDITPYTAGKNKASGGKKLIKLSSNENPLGASPRAVEAFKSQAGNLHRYPDAGHADLREAIGKAYDLNPEHIMCGAGSDEHIHLLCQAYVGEGDEVLYSEHGFLMYQIAARAAGGVPVTAPEQGLRTDVDAMLRAVTNKTRVVFVANPNNPTGSYITKDELHRLHAGLPKNVLLVVDGAYQEYVEADDYSDGRELATAHDNVAVLHTFSKIYGLPALRLGWSYASPAITDVLNRLRGPFNINSAALAAGIAAVEDQTYVQDAILHNTQWRGWLAAQLTNIGLTVHPSQGNFILVEFPDHGNVTASAANAALMHEGIIPREVGNYGLPNCLRITIGTEEENHAVADTLTAFMKA